MAEALRVARSRRGLAYHLRSRQDILLALVLGGFVLLLLNNMPLEAALASSGIVAFLILALIDTRAAVLALLLVRSVIDYTQPIELISASGSSPVNTAAMLSFIAIAVGLAHISLSHLNVRRVPLATPTMAFLAIAFLGVMSAPDREKALQDWIRSLSAFMIYVLVVDTIRTRSDMRWLIQVLLWSTVIPIFNGINQFVTNGGDRVSGVNRIYGTFSHPAAFSMFMAQLLPLAVVMLLHTRSRIAKVALVVLVPGIAFSIYGAQTRGAWIGVFVAVAVFMGARARWSLLLVPLMAGALFFGVPSIRARFQQAGNQSGSLVWRQEQWSNAIAIESPVQLVTIGAGFDAVEARTGNLTHNEYIRLLVETGVIGLAIMLMLYRRLGMMAIEAYRKAETPFERDLMLAFLMAFAARAVIALSDNIIVYPALEWYFWAFAALMVAASGAYQPGRFGQREPRVSAEPSVA
jgi:hypothetical protein